MERLLNDGWQFQKTGLDGEQNALQEDNWQSISLPHDWLIWQADRLYEDGIGWYRRTLIMERMAEGECWLLHFDGVYMNCDVMINGRLACEHKYGYTAFDCDMTPWLHEGENEIIVLVRHQSPNSRWYSGAGIFRDVTLLRLPQRHIVPNGLYISQKRQGDGFRLTITSEIADYGACHPTCVLNHCLYDENGALIAQTDFASVSTGEYSLTLDVSSPKLWSCANPNLYTLITTLTGCGEPQALRTKIGFRTLELTTDRGLMLNGEALKLKGVCLHHDLGLLGAAYNRRASRRQLLLMRDMGVNAIRTSHNPPAAHLMELCDELGLLVVDEAFDMWERPKTRYDYARFFPEWAERDVQSWVRRDRNHPCLLMWSIGNEIYDTHISERGQELTRMLAEWVRRHDPRANAPVTIGSNYMPWENAQRCADIVKLAGYNYGEKYYEAHHREHPDWMIYGSETSSIVISRAVYHFPFSEAILCDDDLQCSALGNSVTSYGAKSYQQCIVGDLNKPYSLGQFVWTGIDYIGEPTPYHTRNSYFGLADTACFPKDPFYLFRALWRDAKCAPTVHIGVYWDFNPGQMIDVPVYCNLPEVELTLNGRGLGRQRLDFTDPKRCFGLWRVPYEPGELVAAGYDENGVLIAADTRKSFGEAVEIVLETETGGDPLLATGEDIAFVTISAKDGDGNTVQNANNRVRVKVEGDGVLLGLDNGDSTDTDAYRTDTRRLFGGRLLAMIGTTASAGDIRVCVTSPGVKENTITLTSVKAKPREGFAPLKGVPTGDLTADDEIRARKILLNALGSRSLNPERRECEVEALVLPPRAEDEPIIWRVTNDAGVDINYASVTAEGGRAVVRAVGDGAFRLRASCGTPHPRVLSQIEFEASGLGAPTLDPYGFVAGALYSLSYGEPGAGNDHGVATSRDGESMFGFENVDFGSLGSDEITLPIFALDGEAYTLQIWLGDPRTPGAVCLGTYVYQKPSIWNVYQPESYTLPQTITGVQTLCFVAQKKMHVKGFSFRKPVKAYARLMATQCDSLYGDSFTRTARGVEGIGNNVSLAFHDMDFGGIERVGLLLEGHTPLEKNAIQVRMTTGTGEESTQLVEFLGGEDEVQRFDLCVPKEACTVTFVFLPGSQFEFYALQFTKVGE